jgi:hypothetical protein
VTGCISPQEEMMEIRTILEATPAPAGLDPAIRESLPPVLVGDSVPVAAGEETPVDTQWPGGLFVFLSYLAAVGLGLGACISAGAAAFGLGRPPLEMLGQAVVMGGGAVFQWWLATQVDHGSRWGWYGAMVELTAAAAAKVWMMAQGNVVGGAIGLCIDVAWLASFWKNRDHFDVDLGG